MFTTFDSGVCMKAYPLLWNFPERFKRHIVLIGTFHLTMAYYKMIGKKMEGCGFADVLMEANLISSGSLLGVMTGNNFSHATHCHKVMFGSLHRLLIQAFMNHQDQDAKEQTEIVFCHTNENIKEAMSDENVLESLKDYENFCQSVRSGSFGKNSSVLADV